MQIALARKRRLMWPIWWIEHRKFCQNHRSFWQKLFGSKKSIGHAASCWRMEKFWLAKNDQLANFFSEMHKVCWYSSTTVTVASKFVIRLSQFDDSNIIWANKSVLSDYRWQFSKIPNHLIQIIICLVIWKKSERRGDW